MSEHGVLSPYQGTTAPLCQSCKRKNWKYTNTYAWWIPARITFGHRVDCPNYVGIETTTRDGTGGIINEL